MAKLKRKPVKGKPIAQHQLFPAVVALWFGALFGLGSLAVRPSLLEEIVIKSRIDLIVPAAAPPLGMTARMLVALIMAALGAIIGTTIARRLARPKVEARERKRTNLSTRDEGTDGREYGFAPEPARPISAHEELGEALAGNPGPGALANRRRALAIEHEEGEFVPHEVAPLPGGAPQIFDIALAGLAEKAQEQSVSQLEEPGPDPVVPEASSPQFGPASVSLDWTNAAPVLPPASGVAAPVPQSIEMQRQMFQPAPAATEQAISSADAAQAGRQVFGMTQPSPAVEPPRQIFGAAVSDDHVPKEFVEAQGFRTSVFDVPEVNPLFAGRGADNLEIAQPAPIAAAIPEAYVPPAEDEAHVDPVAAATPPGNETGGPAPEPEAPLPSPSTLGMTDLAARLADSMRRRRAARAGPAPVSAPAAPEEITPEAEAEAAAEAEEQPAPGIPRFAEPPFEAPAARPVTHFAEAPRSIPAALRPLDLSGFEEDDRGVPHGLIPPRRIAMPAEIAGGPGPAPEPAIPAPAADPAAEPEAAEEAEVAEENYASLLNVAPSPAIPRNPFVRIEEAFDAEPETVEPVVIFPGQTGLPGSAASTGQGDDAAAFRRFDSPANAGQGQPVAANEAAGGLPSEETTQALRSALANLQRMSGAA